MSGWYERWFRVKAIISEGAMMATVELPVYGRQWTGTEGSPTEERIRNEMENESIVAALRERFPNETRIVLISVKLIAAPATIVKA